MSSEQAQMKNPSFAPFIPPPINSHGRLDSSAYLDRLMTGYAIAILVMQTFAMPAEVLLRRKFGERYLDPLMVFLGFWGIQMVGLFNVGVSTMTGETSLSVTMFGWLYLALVIVHRVALGHRNLKGERWHSHSEGVSWAIITIPARIAAEIAGFFVPVRVLGVGYRDRFRLLVAEIVHMIAEPMVVWFVGTILFASGNLLGMVLVCSGGAMLIKGILRRQYDRARYLDSVDAQIESQHRSEVLAGTRDVDETEGFTVTGAHIAAAGGAAGGAP